MGFSNKRSSLSFSKKHNMWKNSTGSMAVVNEGTIAKSYAQVIVWAFPDEGILLVNNHKFSVTTSKHYYVLREKMRELHPNLKPVYVDTSDLWELVEWNNCRRLESNDLNDETLKALEKLGLDISDIKKQLVKNRRLAYIMAESEKLNMRTRKLLNLEYKNLDAALLKLLHDAKKKGLEIDWFMLGYGDREKLNSITPEIVRSNLSFFTKLQEYLPQNFYEHAITSIENVLHMEVLNEIGD